MDEIRLEDELVSTWQVVGAAVQGVSHQKLGLPCQDALEYRVFPNGSLLVALADGAGSAVFADSGARQAVQTAIETISAGLETDSSSEGMQLEELVYQAFEAARQDLQKLAEEQEQELRDYATTLTCVVVLADRIAIGQLGDGAVVVQDADGSYRTVTRVQRGEYANETYFLTQEDALDRLEVQVIGGPIRALAAMSDGLTRLALKMPSYEPHIAFFKPLFAYLQETTSTAQSEADRREPMAAFLASERVCARTDDDKSLALAIRSFVELDESRDQGLESPDS